MSKWIPKEIHIFMDSGHLCGYTSTRNWPEEYMSESAGLYQKLPVCQECIAELQKFRAERKRAASDAVTLRESPRAPKLVLWDYRTD